MFARVGRHQPAVVLTLLATLAPAAGCDPLRARHPAPACVRPQPTGPQTLEPEALQGPFPRPVAVEPMLIKQALSVPDRWNTGLETITVVLVESVEQIEAPQTTAQPNVDPYVLGGTRITPAGDAEFQSTEQLSVSFRVHSAGLTPARQPDVTVDYLTL